MNVFFYYQHLYDAKDGRDLGHLTHIASYECEWVGGPRGRLAQNGCHASVSLPQATRVVHH